MPIFQLTEQPGFPDPSLAESNGLLAFGGDLTPSRLLEAYRLGIFPWYGEGDPILWWFISPRLVIYLEEFHIPRRLVRYARNSGIEVTRNRSFKEVITACSETRRSNGEGTWISPEMIKAYTILYKMGYAHSFECWRDGQLVGGLYGVSLGKIFFGESMFSIVKSASQLALISLVEYLQRRDFHLIDCQMKTAHLLRFGAREVSRTQFQQLLTTLI